MALTISMRSIPQVANHLYTHSKAGFESFKHLRE